MITAHSLASISKNISSQRNANKVVGILFCHPEVVFKILCHSPKLCKKQGMTPCKTLTLTKP